MTKKATIIYTLTDEAPALATRAWLPIVKAFADTCEVNIETRDISLAGRILANFPDSLKEDQKISDALAELGDVVKQPDAVVIKLPNISASISQLNDAIAELQSKGYDVPKYDPENKEIVDRYSKVLGSAVNPVLREGNSDRRAPNAVKQAAKKHPHSMGEWSSDSKTDVASMPGGDFRSNEKSQTVSSAGKLKIEFVGENGESKVLKDSISVIEGEVIDTSFMDVAKLQSFLQEQLKKAKDENILFSLHMKATMMKVSDPIIFGYTVKQYFKEVFAKHGEAIEQAGANPNNGLGNILAAIQTLPAEKKNEIEADIRQLSRTAPTLRWLIPTRG